MATSVTTVSAVSTVLAGAGATGVGPDVPVPAVAAAAAAGAGGGQNVPAGGESVPATPATGQIGRAVDEINSFLRANARQFLFQIDSSTGKSQVTVVNPQTGEIIRQIPDTHALLLAQNIADSGMPLAGLLMDEQA